MYLVESDRGASRLGRAVETEPIQANLPRLFGHVELGNRVTFLEA